MLLHRKVKKIIAFYMSDDYSPELLEEHFDRSEIFFVQLVLFLCTLFTGKNLNKEKKAQPKKSVIETFYLLPTFHRFYCKEFENNPIVHLY